MPSESLSAYEAALRDVDAHIARIKAEMAINRRYVLANGICACLIGFGGSTFVLKLVVGDYLLAIPLGVVFAGALFVFIRNNIARRHAIRQLGDYK